MPKLHYIGAFAPSPVVLYIPMPYHSSLHCGYHRCRAISLFSMIQVSMAVLFILCLHISIQTKQEVFHEGCIIRGHSPQWISVTLIDQLYSRLDRSRSQRILWLLEELKVDYEIKTYKRQNQLAPEELKRIHPLGKAPVVTIESDTMGKPLVLAESSFIIEYLIDHFGTWHAPERYQKGKDGQVGGETEEWTRYRHLMPYAEGSLMPLLVIALIFNGQPNPCNLSLQTR